MSKNNKCGQAIDTLSKSVRTDIIPERTRDNLKKFVINHIIPGTHFTDDNWVAYNFLEEEDQVWTLESDTHTDMEIFGLVCKVQDILNNIEEELNLYLKESIR